MPENVMHSTTTPTEDRQRFRAELAERINRTKEPNPNEQAKLPPPAKAARRQERQEHESAARQVHEASQALAALRQLRQRYRPE